ncbi:MAG TPA: Asp-tRNA(Asn)/Glu-tRNA(Gln) amidotransferase subunit GatA [Vicinamibacterales bacterium]|nr:Asp-tRNA(Asn)/Glu-tRNA(Gln) amidotransferase subunit GatA [Vicinamibacterales bacterium]
MPDSYATAIALRDAIDRRQLSAEAACRHALDRIAALDGSLHAFLHVDAERALARARTLDRGAASTGPLHGVPIALKDNIAVRGMKTTAGSRVLENYVSPFDATVVEKLERAGAVIVGKTVCDEFAMGSSTEHCAFGPARNPWATDRIPGGSSGGSAVAVAAGMTPIALGSDTGGSIRQPAALCGIVGLKPTYGRVSRYGLVAFASSLDQIGPLSRSVADAALTLEVLSGADPRDSTAAAQVVPAFSRDLTGAARGLRVGVPRHLLGEGLDDGVRARFDESLQVLEGLGVSIRTVELPHARHAIPVYYLVGTAEASSNLARYDGVRYGVRATDASSLGDMYDRTRSAGFGAEVKRRIMLGTYVLSAGYYDAYYLKAQQVRTLIRRDFEHAFEDVDVVATPTSPTPAFPLGERTDDPLQMYLADVFTVSAPLAGLPAISVPCGLSQDRLPVGLQLTGRAWDEATLFRLADAYERATSWSTLHPPVAD